MGRYRLYMELNWQYRHYTDLLPYRHLCNYSLQQNRFYIAHVQYSCNAKQRVLVFHISSLSHFPPLLSEIIQDPIWQFALTHISIHRR
jgi:hypothetical protein